MKFEDNAITYSPFPLKFLKCNINYFRFLYFRVRTVYFMKILKYTRKKTSFAEM